MLRQIVNSQLLQPVPGVYVAQASYARRKVSWTRSSASEGSRANVRAKRATCGRHGNASAANAASRDARAESVELAVIKATHPGSRDSCPIRPSRFPPFPDDMTRLAHTAAAHRRAGSEAKGTRSVGSSSRGREHS